MKVWRTTVVVVILASVGLMVLAALRPDWGPAWQRWSGLRLMRPGFHPWPWAPGSAGPIGRLGVQVAGLLAQVLVGVVVAFAWPGPVRRMSDAFAGKRSAWLRFLAIGALLAVALITVSLLAVLSVHTFPLPFVLGAVFFVAALGGVVSLTFRAGRELLTRAGWAGGSPIWSLALGTLIVFALTRIPYLGIAVLIIVWLTGAGAAIATRFGSGEAWSLAPLSEDRLE
ncbi:MAG: hypothetical protein AB1449_11335 [Chloroflexota bacterium]